MSLSDRRKVVLLLAALPLAACGFTPVYKEGGAARGLLNGAIRFNLIESTAGFQLLEQLEAQLGAPGTAHRFDASVELTVWEEELVLTATTAVVRYTLTGAATVTVKSAETGDQVFTAALRETVGYTGNAQTLVTGASRRDANERLIRSLANKIVLRLSATAESWAE